MALGGFLGGLGNITAPIMDAVSRIYLLKIQRDLAEQDRAKNLAAERADWEERLRFQQGLQEPERQAAEKRAQAERRWQAAQFRLNLVKDRPDTDQEKQAALQEVQAAAADYFGVAIPLPTTTATVTTGQREIPGVPGFTVPRGVSGVMGGQPTVVPAQPARTEAITEQRRILTMGGQAVDPKALQAIHEQKRADVENLGKLVASGAAKPQDLWNAVAQFNAYTRQLRQQAIAGGMNPTEAEAAFPSFTLRAAQNIVAAGRPTYKRVAIVDSQGKVLREITVPSGTDVKMVTGAGGPKTVAIVDPRTGQIVRQFQVPAGTQVITVPTKAAGGAGTAGPSSATFGDWEVLPPLTKSGESRYRNTQTGQVLSRAGAQAIFRQTQDVDLGKALGTPLKVKPLPSRQEAWAEVERLAKRIAQIEALPENTPVVARDRFQQEYDRLVARRQYLLSLLAVGR